jgi:rhodanese-related sulfurtransferase
MPRIQRAVRFDPLFYNGQLIGIAVKFVIDNIFIIAIAVVSGLMLLWPALGRRSGSASLDTLSATRLINDGALIVDVSEPDEFASGHLPNARNIPLAEFDKRVADLPSGKALLIVCASGQRSGKAVSQSRRAGRQQAFSLQGGLQAWRQAGLPVVK